LVQGLQATTGLMESTELNTHLQSRLVSVVGGGRRGVLEPQLSLTQAPIPIRGVRVPL
jgi:hypothetical protein